MNKKNILFSIITPLTIASATLVTVLPLSISNNNSNIVLKNSSVTKNVFSVDGTDWDGYISGSFTANDYVVDTHEQTITYYGDNSTKTKTYVAQNLVIPSKVMYANNEYNVIIGYYGFAATTGVNITGNLTISEGITSIGNAAFYYCSHLVNVDIPSTVTSIGEQAFFSCNRLKGPLIIQDSVTTIGSYAFEGCCNFNSLTIGSGLTSIENGTFYQCNLFSGNLIIPHNIKTIKENAFWGCQTINNLFIESSNISISDHAFMSCSSLKTITTNLSDINNLALNKGGESFSFCGYSGGIVYNNNELLSSSTVLEKLQSDGGLFNSWVAGNDSSSDNIDISGIFSDTYSSNEGTFFNPIKNL